MSDKRKYSQKKQFSNVYNNNYNPDSFECFWTKEPHRYTPKQRQIVQKRMNEDYEKLHDQVYNECCYLLGFDVNSDFFIDTPFNLKHLPNTRPLVQKEVIALNENILNKLINAPKFFLFKQNYRQDNKDRQYYCTTYFYCTLVDTKPVIFTLTTRIGSHEDINIHPLNSISVHILLKGKIPFLVSRFDTKPSAHHPNKLDQNGKLPYDKVYIKGPHEHIYNEKLAVVFPFSRFVGHYDAIPAPFFTKFSNAVRYIKNKYYIQDRFFDNSNETFLSIPKQNIPDIEKDKKTQAKTEKKLHKKEENDIINLISL